MSCDNLGLRAPQGTGKPQPSKCTNRCKWTNNRQLCSMGIQVLLSEICFLWQPCYWGWLFGLYPPNSCRKIPESFHRSEARCWEVSDTYQGCVQLAFWRLLKPLLRLSKHSSPCTEQNLVLLPVRMLERSLKFKKSTPLVSPPPLRLGRWSGGTSPSWLRLQSELRASWKGEN